MEALQSRDIRWRLELQYAQTGAGSYPASGPGRGISAWKSVHEWQYENPMTMRLILGR